MSHVMAGAHGSDGQRPRDADIEARRARARRTAVLLGLLAAAFYVGYIVYGAVKGLF